MAIPVLIVGGSEVEEDRAILYELRRLKMERFSRFLNHD